MNSVIKNAVRLRPIVNSLRSMRQRFASTEQQAHPDPNQPLKFLGSEAQKFKASDSRGYNPDVPEIQTYSVVGSVAIFLLYFCVFREENDIDAKLGRSIFETVPHLEKSTLISLYKYNLENDIDNTDVIKRMLAIGMDPLTIE